MELPITMKKKNEKKKTKLYVNAMSHFFVVRLDVNDIDHEFGQLCLILLALYWEVGYNWWNGTYFVEQEMANEGLIFK